jgi:chitin disaccharide deacetylase
MPGLAPEDRLPPLGSLMKRAFLGRIDRAEVAAELARQLAAFETAMGRPPDFVDGHQHVHQLPVIRDAVVEALRARPGTYVRLCGEAPGRILRRGVSVAKTMLIGGLSGPLAAAARRHGIPANRGFRGVYDFSGAVPYEDLLERFVTPATDQALIMVHPGHPDQRLRERDRVVEQRAVEYGVLAGDRFAAILDRAQVRIGRLALTKR